MASRATAIKGGAAEVSSPASVTGGLSGGRRRSSGGNGVMFAGLVNQKRNSQDAATQARRQSFNEQKPAPGIIGNLWNQFTTGHK